MTVETRDRRHFALVGEAKAIERAEQRLAALRTTPAERIAAGFLLGAVPRDAAIEASLDARAEAQIGLARRRATRS
ncbi:MAG: hypothetical protein ABI629_16500 [bacterium]